MNTITLTNPYQAHADSIAALQSSLGAACPVITLSGKDYQIIPGSATLRKDLSSGGFQMNADFSFTILVIQFGVATNAKTAKTLLLQKPITYLGDSYKSVSASIIAGGLQLHVEANSYNQNA